MTALAARLRKPKSEPIMLTEHGPIRFRFIQSAFWAVIIGFVGVGFIAGLYFLLLEVNWTVFGYHLFWLKAWWDGTAPYHGGMGNLITSGNWTAYRHDERNLGEPAAAILFIMTVRANRKMWGRRISMAMVAVRAVLVLVLAVALIAGGTWLIVYGIPRVWAVPSWAETWQIQEMALGFLVGRILHPLWAPAGATLQGAIMDWAVDRAATANRTPLWVRYPVAPPQARERFVWMRSHDTEIEQRRAIPKWVLAPGLLIVIFTVVMGLLAKYGVAHGMTIPFFAPPGS